MSKDKNKEICKLININEDAAEFYEEAQENAKSPQNKETFRELEQKHKAVITSLSQHVVQNGGKVDVDETIIGEMRQLWGELSAKVSNDVDATFIKHLEEAEDRCLHQMEDIMNDDDISAEMKSMLQDEYKTLQQTHDYMKALKEQTQAA